MTVSLPTAQSCDAHLEMRFLLSTDGLSLLKSEFLCS